MSCPHELVSDRHRQPARAARARRGGPSRSGRSTPWRGRCCSIPGAQSGCSPIVSHCCAPRVGGRSPSCRCWPATNGPHSLPTRPRSTRSPEDPRVRSRSAPVSSPSSAIMTRECATTSGVNARALGAGGLGRRMAVRRSGGPCERGKAIRGQAGNEPWTAILLPIPSGVRPPSCAIRGSDPFEPRGAQEKTHHTTGAGHRHRPGAR